MATAEAVIPEREYLSMYELTAWSGISRSQIKRWVRSGLLNRYKPGNGRRTLFSLAEVRRLIQDGVRPTN
jgi:hypothetical protein